VNVWRWLTTPDPTPGYPPRKIARIAARFLLFLLVVTLVQTLLGATPLRPFVASFWGSAVVVFLLYIPFARILILDTPGASRQGQGLLGGQQKPSASAVRRKERNRYAGVKKGPPGGGRGGRR